MMSRKQIKPENIYFKFSGRFINTPSITQDGVFIGYKNIGEELVPNELVPFIVEKLRKNILFYQ